MEGRKSHEWNEDAEGADYCIEMVKQMVGDGDGEMRRDRGKVNLMMYVCMKKLVRTYALAAQLKTNIRKW